MGEDERAIWRRHIDAVRADRPEEFLGLMETDGVALGQFCHNLDEKERAVFDRIAEYCRRWRTECGPHPDYARQRNAELEALRCSDPFGDPGPLPPEPAHYSWSELPRWDDTRTKTLRGEWAAVLEQAVKAPQPGSDPVTATSAVPSSAAVARRFLEALERLRENIAAHHRTEVDEELAVQDHIRRSSRGPNPALLAARKERSTLEAARPALVEAVASGADDLAVAADDCDLDSGCADKLAIALRRARKLSVPGLIEKLAPDVEALAARLARRKKAVPTTPMQTGGDKPSPEVPPEKNGAAHSSAEADPRPLGRTEKWILDVLRQEPDRSFKIKDLLAVRRRKDQAACPVERSSLCEALAWLRKYDRVTYVRRSYMHKK